jgi:epoxyqueuosine reductase
LAQERADDAELVARIRAWGQELGFASIGIAGVDVSAATPWLMRWLEHRPARRDGLYGQTGGSARSAAGAAGGHPLGDFGSPAVLAEGCRCRADPCRPPARLRLALCAWPRLSLGGASHRLQKLADRLRHESERRAPAEPFACRVFSDSAPVLESEFARQSGVAWRGKHTLTLTRTGSWHFLGEIYISLPLPADPPIDEHCGSCRRCLDACPTAAIVAPYEVDARRCISYLTIELRGSIPVALRPLIGNRIYGCDDCQLCCPWNRFAQIGDPDFAVRNGLDAAPLTTLFAWSEDQFNHLLAGSPIRRIGHPRWLRNIAVALGNAERSPAIVAALSARRDDPSPLVREHVDWALAQHAGRPVGSDD